MNKQLQLENAFQLFLNGWATGNWQSFLDLLSDDLIFQYPAGTYKGRHLPPNGKQKMIDWAQFHSDRGDRIQIKPTFKLLNEDWALFCADSVGLYNGERYEGSEAYLLRVQDNQVIEYREYIGDIDGWLSDVRDRL